MTHIELVLSQPACVSSSLLRDQPHTRHARFAGAAAAPARKRGKSASAATAAAAPAARGKRARPAARAADAADDTHEEDPAHLPPKRGRCTIARSGAAAAAGAKSAAARNARGAGPKLEAGEARAQPQQASAPAGPARDEEDEVPLGQLANVGGGKRRGGAAHADQAGAQLGASVPAGDDGEDAAGGRPAAARRGRAVKGPAAARAHVPAHQVRHCLHCEQTLPGLVSTARGEYDDDCPLRVASQASAAGECCWSLRAEFEADGRPFVFWVIATQSACY